MQLTFQDIHKRYSRTTVLNGVNLTVNPGEITALLGVNGSGKTTLLNIASGLIAADDGNVHFNGTSLEEDAINIKARLGYLSDDNFLLPGLTVRQFLNFTALLYNVPSDRIENFLQTTGQHFLGEDSIFDKSVNHLSLGQQRKVAICSTLIHQPSMLLLDEPFSSLDRESCQKLIDFLKEKADSDAAVMIATHDFEHIFRFCTHVAVLHKGVIRWYGSQSQFLAKGNTPESAFSTVLRKQNVQA